MFEMQIFYLYIHIRSADKIFWYSWTISDVKIAIAQ